MINGHVVKKELYKVFCKKDWKFSCKTDPIGTLKIFVKKCPYEEPSNLTKCNNEVIPIKSYAKTFEEVIDHNKKFIFNGFKSFCFKYDDYISLMKDFRKMHEICMQYKYSKCVLCYLKFEDTEWLTGSELISKKLKQI